MTARCALYMSALKIFENPGVRPQLLFSEVFNGLLFRSILWMSVQILKFVALPVPEIIRCRPTQKIAQSLDTPTLSFLPNFSYAFVRMDPVNVSAKFTVRSFTRSWDNRDCRFGFGLLTPKIGEGEAVGGRGFYGSKERWWVPIGPP